MTPKLISLILALALLFSACSENNSDEFWIDVRTQEEFDSGHLEEAILIPHDQIAARIAEVTQNKDAVIHLYCRSGGRAGRAKTALEELGFTQIINEGGYNEIQEKRMAK